MIVGGAAGGATLERGEEGDVLEGPRGGFADGLPHDGLMMEGGRSEGGLPNTLERRVEELETNLK